MRVSISTPSAFIATSDMPAVAPYTNRARQSVSRFGASEGRISAIVHRASSPRSAVRAPKRWLTQPASGIATEAPIAGKARARPRSPALSVGVLLDPGHAGREGAGDRAVHAEDGGHGVPRPLQLPYVVDHFTHRCSAPPECRPATAT